MKKGFSLLELIFVILIIGIILSQSIYRNNLSKIQLAKNQIMLHLKYARYVSMIDNKYNYKNNKWFKKRWSLKFMNCQSSIGGVYYVLYNDLDSNGAVKKEETLRDPLTNNYIYSFQCVKDDLYDKSKFVLLTKEYGITRVEVSCNKTSTIGQITFGIDGKIYARNGEKESDYEIKELCTIKLFDKNSKLETIKIYPNTGYIEG